MRRMKIASLEPFGISPHQSRALGVIARLASQGEVRPSTIAESLGIAPRSATEVIDALEARGLVERSPSPTDRRATVIRLTGEGQALRDRLQRNRVDRTAEFVAVLDGDEQRELARLLAKLVGD